MLLRSVEVRDFRNLRQAALTFGPGLNILFGPNALGKSTLVEAIRAAFLLPTGSAAKEDFVPWNTDLVPRVTVEFESPRGGDVWRITKSFDSGTRGSARLDRLSTSGLAIPTISGRAVDGRLRELLAWGVKSPGGKGGVQGFGESYLTSALLGRQDNVTSILASKLDDDKEDSGRNLLTKALGALAQNQLVGTLLDRLDARCREVFTEKGRLRGTADSPLVRRAAQIKESDERLRELEERVRKSDEIERQVQSLCEHEQTAQDQCCRLTRHLELLRAVLKAETVCDHARQLRAAEAEVAERERIHRDTVTALRAIDEQLAAARELAARAAERSDQIRSAATTTADARRTELAGRRDAAVRTAESAREAIDAERQVHARENEVTEARSQLEHAQSAAARAERLAALARLELEWRTARALIDARQSADQKYADAQAGAEATKAELTGLQDALTAATQSLAADRAAIDAARREASERELVRETLLAKQLRAQEAERAAKDFLALARTAAARREQCEGAERAIANLAQQKLELETQLAENAAEKAATDSAQGRLLLGAVAATAAAGIALTLAVILSQLRLPFAVLFAAGSVAAAVVALKLARGWQRREKIAATRERLAEQRNEVAATCVVAQSQADAARRDRDEAITRVTETLGIESGAEVAAETLCERQDELRQLDEQLARLETDSRLPPAVSPEYIEEKERAIAALEADVRRSTQSLDQVRQDMFAAEAGAKAATAAAASVDLFAVERQLGAARLEAGSAANESAIDVAEADSLVQSLRDPATAAANRLQVALERLTDAQSRHNELSRRFDQPAEEVLAQAERIRDEANLALNNLDETTNAEVQSADAESRQAKENVTRLEDQRTSEQSAADAALESFNTDSAMHDGLRLRLSSLSGTPIPADSDVAEAELQRTRAELYDELNAGTHGAAVPVTELENQLDEKLRQLAATTKNLIEARTRLSDAGGAVVRSQRDQERETLERLRTSAEELELEFKATQRLHELLKEAEEKQAAHLGRGLAKPVTERFIALTGDRYADVVLDPGLNLRTVVAQGGERDPAALSVGERDQLATLIRLALAAHLQTMLLLDDQLTHSDRERMLWFRDRLRASVRDHGHQIIVFTCRPEDYAEPHELPASTPCDVASFNGCLAVVDLTNVVRWQ